MALFLDKALVLGPKEQQGALRDLGSLLHPLAVAYTASDGMDVPLEDSEENSKVRHFPGLKHEQPFMRAGFLTFWIIVCGCPLDVQFPFALAQMQLM